MNALDWLKPLLQPKSFWNNSITALKDSVSGTAVPNLELMRLQINTLFVLDDNNDILSTNNWERTSGPRLFIGRTPSGNIWRYHHSLSPAQREGLDLILHKVPPLTSQAQDAPIPQDTEIRKFLEQDEPLTKVWSGPAFCFTEIPEIPPDTVQITKFNKNLLQDELVPWGEDVDVDMPLFASLENGKAASLCGSVRITDGAHEAGVETLERFRNKGHAKKAVAAWANYVASCGARPLYSTSWENEASQNVARHFGLTLYGADHYYT